MSTDGSAVVLVLPGDTVDTIITKIQDTGTSNIQLLVPEGITTFQSLSSCEQLHKSVEANLIDLMLISSDEKTLKSAHQSKISTIVVEGTHVVLPDICVGGPVITPIDVPRKQQPAASVAQQPAVQQPVARKPDYDVPEEYDDFAAELDNLGDVMSGQAPPATADYDPFAELDSLGDVMSGQTSAAERKATPVAPPPRRRIRPEDIVLTEDEVKQAASVRSGGGRKREDASSKKKKKDNAKKTEIKTPSLFASRKRSESEKQTGIAGIPIPLAFAALLIVGILLVAIVVLYVWFSRATVSVVLPSPQSQEIVFQNQPVLVAHIGSEGSIMSIQAEPINVTVESTATGQVLDEIQSPGEPARGVLTFVNTGFQPLNLPEGTEFIATNAQGQDVTFVIDAPATIPSASTVRQGLQMITTFGQAQVNVTARSAGSNSNVAANTIKHIILPGQTPIAANSGTIELSHGPLQGGSEKSIRVVKEQDVQRVLGEALTSLDNQATQQLHVAAAKKNLNLETTSVYPSRRDLSEGRGYEVAVKPGIGQEVGDGNNSSFSVNVKGNFSGLATLPNKPLRQQLEILIPEQLKNSGVLTPGLKVTTTITDWRWDNEKLTVSGVFHPIGAGQVLEPSIRIAIRNAIKGKPVEEARKQLEEFKRQGIIGGYTLPNSGSLPSWDFLLTLQVIAAQQ